MHERLKDFDDYADFGNRSFGEIIARICRDLGIEPDWEKWQNEGWALEEARTLAATGTQGNRISNLGEHVCQELVVPAGTFDFAAVGDFGFLDVEDVDCHVP
jgi:hypothetical protein